MMKIKSLCAVLLAAMLCICSISSAAPPSTPLSYSLGDQVQDFTFTTYDGQEINLYDVLQEKKAVMINIWATWCGPCRNEFPFMEEAYKQYQDQIEIFALSCEPTDTDDVLAKFAADMGLTFKIGQDPVDFLYALGVGSIPTTLMVDRFGTICFIESGAQTSVSAFMRLFDAFIGDDYTESVLYDKLPPMKPNVMPSTEAELALALNVDGGDIVFSNDTGTYSWPMVVGEKDGRSVVISSNQGAVSSESLVNATVTAKEGDALAVTFKVSSEAGYDLMQLRVNGKVVKSFGGEKDWMTYAYPFPADGDYAVSIVYANDAASSAGANTLWVDSVALLSGDEAAGAVAKNPVYPIGEAVAITVQNPAAREIVFTDPTGMIASYYGNGPFFIVPDDEVVFNFDLAAEYDPESAIVGFNYDGRTYALTECIVDGCFTAVSGGDSLATTGYCDSTVILYPDPTNIYLGKTLTYFKDEANVNAFLAELTSDRAGTVKGSWAYVDAEESAAVERREENASASSESAYIFRCEDQHGNPVAGVMLQVCDAETCQVLMTNADGVCELTAVPYAWEVHILKAPEGYTADSTGVVLAPVEGGELLFTLTKN